MASCGTCTSPQIRGGANVPNVCGGDATACIGVTPWDPNKPWYEYTVGERHIGSNNKLYECKDIGYCYLDPAGPYGSFGWLDVGPCN